MRIYFFILTVNIIISSIGFFYLRNNFAWARGWLFNIFFLLLAVNTVACRALPQDTPILVARLSAWLSGQWIAIMYYIIIIALVHTLIYFAGKAASLTLPHTKIASVALVLALCFIGWGSYRAMRPVLRTENIVTTKLPTKQSYKIVFLTDLHLGQLLGRQYAEKLVARINEQKPDLVLISGDILDEKQRYVDKENSLEPLKNIQSNYGVYMAYGNHDYLDRPEEWGERLKQVNIQPLRNASQIINNNLKLVGVNDWSRSKGTREITLQASGNDSYYSIIMDHQPRRMLAAAEAGYDLYLAGHTHTGQLYPNRQITKRMYLLDYGRTNFGAMTAITNNGYGFWGPPVRTEEAPEMVIINLKGK